MCLFSKQCPVCQGLSKKKEGGGGVVMDHTRQFICVASESRFVAFPPLWVHHVPHWTTVTSWPISLNIRTEHTLCMHAESGVLASPSSSFFYIKKQQPLCLLGPWSTSWSVPCMRSAALRTEVTSTGIDRSRWSCQDSRTIHVHTPLYCWCWSCGSPRSHIGVVRFKQHGICNRPRCYF
jgi:hypothetical protein